MTVTCFKIACIIYAITLCESLENRTKQIKRKFISQPLDHFVNGSLSWQMRYYERRSFWKPNGPIFIYVGGEFPASASFLKRSGMVRLAVALKGCMFVTEHRFYGESVPPDVTREKMTKYLNSRQALADLACFVKQLKRERGFAASKVVLIGASYSGNLASWMRQKYPELVDAAWASSAPVLAKIDFDKYYEGVGIIYKTIGGDSCYEDIENLFNHQTLLFDNSNTDILKKEQNICSHVNLENQLQRQVYFNNFISRLDQHRSPEEIKLICKLMSNFANAKQSLHTIEYATDLPKLRKEYSCDPEPFGYELSMNADDIAWAWQCCSEFGYFITTSSKNQPFSNNIPLEFSIRKCRTYFGDNMNKSHIQTQIRATNEIYGGRTPNVTKVVFVNGLNDPWHYLGVLADINPDSPAILIKGAGHGDDFKPSKSGDSINLKSARSKIKELLKKWIS